MSPDGLFGAAGTMAMLGWVVLVLGPRRFPWLSALPLVVVPALLSAFYAVLVLTSFAGAEGGFGSLTEVRALFSDDWVLLAGWVHYLAFDLVVGSLMAARMDRAGVGRIVQAPILLLVFLFGPLGALLALLVEGTLQFARVVPRRLPFPIVSRPEETLA